MLELALALATSLNGLCKNMLDKKANSSWFSLRHVFFGKFLFQKGAKTVYFSAKVQNMRENYMSQSALQMFKPRIIDVLMN